MWNPIDTLVEIIATALPYVCSVKLLEDEENMKVDCIFRFVALKKPNAVIYYTP
jgi:hypothetical protein